MERSDILKEVNEVFIDCLEDEDIDLKDETTAGDVAGWDSLTHIELVVAIERHFRIRFSSREIQSWANIGEMITTIAGKTAGA